jgi:hypothetical protein
VIEDSKRIQKFLMEVHGMGKNLFLDLILEQGVTKGLRMGREEGLPVPTRCQRVEP